MYNITKGEAVFVNLAERGDLFVLLGGEDEAKIVFSHFRQGTSQGPSLVELSQYQYPKLVHFKNISDPTSIEMVMEFQSCADKSQRMLAEKKCLKADLFETIYGRGVRLRSIIIERTDEAVTRSIASHMPSYRDQEQYLKWFRTLPYGDPRAVNANDFGAIGGSNAD